MCENSRFACVDGFAEELDEIVYEGMSNWLISFRSFLTLWSAHCSYLLVFSAIVVCGCLSFKHAKDNGGKYFQFWWGALLHGAVSESGLTAAKYWHAQAPVMFFGKHLPLHMVLFYPSLFYISSMAVQKMRLKLHTEPAAIGLVAMMMELPFRIVSAKFLHITFHDSDPSYAAKLYGVPWIEIVSSLVFCSSYVILFHGLKLWYMTEDYFRWEACGCDRKGNILTAASAFLSPIAGVVQKFIFFHVLHDGFSVHPATCLLFVVSLYLAVVLCDEACEDRRFSDISEHPRGKKFLLYQLTIFLSCLLYLALLGRPQNEISIGRHEPTGDCTTLICTRTPIGKTQKRNKYLCADAIRDRANFVYNFACVPNGGPCLNAIWYTICGTSIRNRIDFFIIILSFVLVVLAFFLTTLFQAIMRKLLGKLPSFGPEENSYSGKRKVNFTEPIAETSDE